MADEKDKQGGEAPKKGKMKLIIILLVVIILLAVLGAGAYFMFLKPKPEAQGQNNQAASANVEMNEELGPLYSFDTFIVNLADAGGSRYLKVTLQVELDNTKNLVEELDKRKPQLRDAILTILSSKRYEEINSAQGKLILKKEVIRRLNNLIPKGKVRQVYLTEFVAQ